MIGVPYYSITRADAMTLLSTEAWTPPPSETEIPQ
jgi:hypothetical protein